MKINGTGIINNQAEKLIEKVSGFGITKTFVNNLCKENGTIDEYKMGKVLVVANAAKDLVNCGFYVNQSFNNKRIPEEKRKFVAALDLTNGVFMVGSQLLLGFTILNKTIQDKITNKLFGGLKEKAANYAKEMVKKNNPNLSGQKLEILAKETAEKFGNKVFSNCKQGFTLASGLIVSTIIAKRLLVPFIATPTAGWFKRKYMDNPEPENQKLLKDDKNLNI
ncbi:MAG: hypothetical protein PHC34_03430 [Candidatus Gastranaerophilales bacterium]|nr:hypothetical protein [Candidatus Gastranaerophilales bacterium]